MKESQQIVLTKLVFQTQSIRDILIENELITLDEYKKKLKNRIETSDLDEEIKEKILNNI